MIWTIIKDLLCVFVQNWQTTHRSEVQTKQQLLIPKQSAALLKFEIYATNIEVFSDQISFQIQRGHGWPQEFLHTCTLFFTSHGWVVERFNRIVKPKLNSKTWHNNDRVFSQSQCKFGPGQRQSKLIERVHQAKQLKHFSRNIDSDPWHEKLVDLAVEPTEWSTDKTEALPHMPAHMNIWWDWITRAGQE